MVTIVRPELVEGRYADYQNYVDSPLVRRYRLLDELRHHLFGEHLDAAEPLVLVQAGRAELAEDSVDSLRPQNLQSLADHLWGADQRAYTFLPRALRGKQPVAVAVDPVLVVFGNVCRLCPLDCRSGRTPR